jgi:hypothetical protein
VNEVMRKIGRVTEPTSQPSPASGHGSVAE